MSLLLSDTFFADPMTDAKDGGKHFFAQFVGKEELINVFTMHL